MDDFYDPAEDTFPVGSQVYWNDPDENISSGWYTIIEKITDEGENSTYLLSNGRYNVEAYQTDLSDG